MRQFVVMVIVCGLSAMTWQASAQPGGGPPPRGGPPGGGGRGPDGFGGGRPASAEEMVAQVFESDKNQDGKLTKEEMTDKRLSRLLGRADANSDGSVTKEELTSLFAKELESSGNRGGGRGEAPGGPGRGGPGLGGPGGPGGPNGRGGFPGGPPQVGQVMPEFVQDMLNLSAEQKTELEALQKEVDGKLDKILTSEQKQQLREMRDRGPGGPGGPGRGGPGRGGPGGRTGRGAGGRPPQ